MTKTLFRPDEDDDIRISVWPCGRMITTVNEESQIQHEGETHYVYLNQKKQKLIEQGQLNITDSHWPPSQWTMNGPPVSGTVLSSGKNKTHE